MRAPLLLALALACAGPARAAGTLLWLVDDPSDEGPRAAERSLAGTGRVPPVLVPFPVSAGAEALPAYLEAFAPAAAIGGAKPGRALKAALRERGLAPRADASAALAEHAVEGPPASRAPEHRARARARLALGDPFGAWEHLSRALELGPPAPGDAELIAAAGRAGDDRWRALAALDALAERADLPAGELAAARREAGRLRLRAGDYPGAAEDLRRALDAAPGDAAAALALAQASRASPEEALVWAGRAAKAADPRARAAALRLRAEVRLDLGDASGAAADAEKALAAAPADLEALGLLARAHGARPEKAREAALRADAAAAAAPLWRRADAHRVASGIWSGAGDAQAALRAWHRVLKLEPDDLEALEALERLGGSLPPPPSEPPPASAPGEEPLDGLLEQARALTAARAGPAAVAAVERLTAAVEDAPGWQRAEAYRQAGRLWKALHYDERASDCANAAQEMDWNSVRTARAAAELEEGDGDPQLRNLLSRVDALRARLQARRPAP